MILDSPLKQGGIYLILSLLVGISANRIRTDSRSIPFLSPQIEQATDENLLLNQSNYLRILFFP